MSKCTRLNKINHYYDSGELALAPAAVGPDSRRCPWSAHNCCSTQAPAREEPARSAAADYPKTILATKSLTNLITIKPRPLVAADRRQRHSPLQAKAQPAELGPARHRLHLFTGGQQQQQQQPRRLKRATRSARQSFEKEELAKTTEEPRAATRMSPGVRTRSGKLMMVEHASPPNSSYKLAFLAAASVLLVALVLGPCAQPAEALSCYNCSSSDNPGCDESFSARAKFNSTDCRELVPAGQEGKVCRKLVQYMHDTKVVIRTCGYIDEHHGQLGPNGERKDVCHKRSGTFAVTMESCNCYKDGCNHSTTLVPTTSATYLSLLLLPLLLLLLRAAGRPPTASK